MSMSDPYGRYPWSTLVPPETGFRSILVDENSIWPFYWGRSKMAGPSLLLRVERDFAIRDRDLRGVTVEKIKDDSAFLLCLSLTDVENSDVFVHFCLRLVEVSDECSNETSVLATVLDEIEKWHDFLGRVKRGLTREQRLGIFGELIVLEEAILKFGPSVALTAWTGPDGASQDFSFGLIHVEVKTLLKRSRLVRIASEFQLDERESDLLFLSVICLEESEVGKSLFELVTSISSQLETEYLFKFQTKLDHIGLFEPERYQFDSWVLDRALQFHVEGDFPRVAASTLDARISKVEYRLDVQELGEFAVNRDQMWIQIEEQIHGS